LVENPGLRIALQVPVYNNWYKGMSSYFQDKENALGNYTKQQQKSVRSYHLYGSKRENAGHDYPSISNI